MQPAEAQPQEQAQTQAPSKPITPQQRERILAGYQGLILLATGFGLVFVVALVIAMMRRRHRNEAAKARPPSSVPAPKDAWAEAGRRARAPSAAQLHEQAGTTPEPREEGSRVGEKRRPVAMITGAAKRVGRAIAVELARAGCDVVFTYNSSEHEAESLAHELSGLGATVSFYRVDLSDIVGVEVFAAGLADTLPRLDILVHNASTYEPTPIAELTAEMATRIFLINSVAPLVLTARLSTLLENTILPGGAAVVAIGDIHAMGRPRKEHAAYAMSKAALHEMVRSLARDLAPRVRVNAIAPGVVAWPEQGEEADPLGQAKYIRRIPLERAGTPEDAAKAVAWLAFQATYMTGEIIRLDGGRWLT